MGNKPTLNEMLDDCQQRMKNDFFTYDAFKNNCQDVQINLLAKYMTNDIRNFIKQSTQQLAKNAPSFVEQMAKNATDLAAKITTAKEGVNEWTNTHLGFDLIPFSKGGIAKRKHKRVYFN